MYLFNSAAKFTNHPTQSSRDRKRRRRNLHRVCNSFSTFAAALIYLFLFQPAPLTAPSAKATAQPKDRTEHCATCTQVAEQKIYAPLIELPESQGTEINLNCRSPHEMVVTPIFYTQKGDAINGPTFTMQPAEVKTVDLKTLMPKNIRNRHDWGGMALSYTGTSLEMWGQLRLLRVSRGGSADITFVNLPDKRSDTRNAVFWLPADGEAIIALGNLSDSPALAELQFSNGDVQEVSIPAFGTELVRRRSEERSNSEKGKPEAVTINSKGVTGSVIPAGVIASTDGSFTSAIRFYDTQNIVQPNLYSTRFRLGNVKARMLLRNTGTKTISATPRFLPVGDDPTAFIDLPSVTLEPNQVADVDLKPLESAVQSDSRYDAVSIQVLNSGDPGSLVGALNGIDTVTGMTYDVPLRDSGGVRISTGAYPWRLDHDVSTIASVTNISPMPSAIVVQINYPGGSYLLDPRRLAAGETAVYDLRKIRDEQVPDRNGNTIPRSVNGGQFRWFIHGAGSGRLLGRIEMLSQSQGISSSYSCNDPCPPQFGDVWFDIPVVILNVNEEAYQTAYEMDYDSYGNPYGPFSPWIIGWWCSDTNVISMNSGEITGLAPGFSDTAAIVQYERYGWDGLNCYDYGPNQAQAQGQAQVGATVYISLTTVAPATVARTGQSATLTVTVASSTQVPAGTTVTIEAFAESNSGNSSIFINPTPAQRTVSASGGNSGNGTFTVGPNDNNSSSSNVVYRARILSVTSGNPQITVTAGPVLTPNADVATLHIN